ncbi:MAG: outer membrane lipoprotein chaperone LolA [Gammaproteobacteria bacterium]|nr:outer membrane lipoprotein chaperone LolA [Gammaproteobacteria bacterium]
MRINTCRLIFQSCTTFLTLLLSSVSAPLFADALNDYFSSTKTFVAHFEQSQFDVDQQLLDKSSGVIRVKRPNKFSLEYLKPYHLLYLADGEKLWSYDEDLEQVIVKPQKETLANSPAMILGNPEILREHYQIFNQGKEQGLDWYELKPNNPDAGFESIGLAFKENNLNIMELKDSFGQTTRLIFSDMQKNIVLGGETFFFKAPKGVDVISQ